MTTKLIQKHLLKGTQELELVDDHVNVRSKKPFGQEETLTIMLTVLDPSPVIGKSYLHFNSRVNGEPLISLFLGKPNTEEFNAFVNTLKQRAQAEFHEFAGLRPASAASGIQDNVFDEPPEFDETDKEHTAKIRQPLDSVRIGECIEMLQQYLEEEDVKPLILALEALKDNPDSEQLLTEAVNAFNGLGSSQGAVLSYAPYMSYVLSDDPFSW